MATGTQTESLTQISPLPRAVNRSQEGIRKPMKKLVRRIGHDHSQKLRRSFQLSFLALNVWIGWEFYAWVRHIETGVGWAGAARPAGVEGWLPIAGLMNLKYWLLTGLVPAIHPAAMFLLMAFLSIAFLFRKAFCSWLCPVGTISEALWRTGRHLFGKGFTLPRWADLPLRGLKYLLLGFFGWAVASMTPAAIGAFMATPFGIVADVKMLNFFRFLGETAAITLTLLALASLFVRNFWCRYLCPYGALLGIVSLFSPLRIRREEEACIDCAKCARACPSSLPVGKLASIRSAECTGCLECVAICPAEGALAMSLPKVLSPREYPHHRRVPNWVFALGIVTLFLGIVGYAKITGHWQSNISAVTYQKLVPRANEALHPMP